MKSKILIEVRGGTIQSIISTNQDVEVIILDYDFDVVAANNYEPDLVLTDSELNNYIEKEVAEANPQE